MLYSKLLPPDPMLFAIDRAHRSASRSSAETRPSFVTDLLSCLDHRITIKVRLTQITSRRRSTWDVNRGDQEGMRSCPPSSTCFIANTAVPVLPKCESNF
jgi:hypothetical protein